MTKEILHGEIQSLEIMIKEELEDIDLEDDLEILQEAFEKIEKLRADYTAKTITLSKIDNDYKIEETEKNKDDMAKVLKSIRNKKKDSQRLKKQNEATAAENLRKAKETEEEKVKAEVKVEKAREVTDAEASAKKDNEKQKAREVTDATASAKTGEENDKIAKQKAREVTDAEASAKKDNEKIDMIVKREAKKAKNAEARANRNKAEKMAGEEKREDERAISENDEKNCANKFRKGSDKNEEVGGKTLGNERNKVEVSERNENEEKSKLVVVEKGEDRWLNAFENDATIDELLESDNEEEEKIDKIAKNEDEDESSNDESPEDGKVEVEGPKYEVARKSREEHLVAGSFVLEPKIVKDVLEHDIKLLPSHAQLGNEVMIEVAAAFPLLQAQRGESVAPSLNLPQIPIKKNEAKELKNETKEKGIEHAEDDIIMYTRRINEKSRKQNSDADEDEEISLDRKRISKKAPDIDEKADDKKQKVAMEPALIIAAQVNVNVSAISYNQFVEYVGDCESPDIKVEKDKLCFKGNGGVNKKDYDVKLKFLKKIDPEKSKYDVQPRAFDFALQKKDARPYWNRLLETKVKQHWLQVDFSKWKEEDDSSDESSGALPTEYRQIYIVNKKYVEFVMDSEPDVSVKPREGIGVYRDSANTLTPSKFLINVDKFFKGSMLAANNEKSPNFNRSYVCSKKLNYTPLAIIRDNLKVNENGVAPSHCMFQFHSGDKEIYIDCRDRVILCGLGRLGVEPQFSGRTSEGLVANYVEAALGHARSWSAGEVGWRKIKKSNSDLI